MIEKLNFSKAPIENDNENSEKIEINNLDLGKIGELLNDKYYKNNRNFTVKVKSFKATDENIYLITNILIQPDPGEYAKKDTFIVLDKDLNEIFTKEEKEYESKSESRTYKGNRVVPGHESSITGYNLIKILKVENNKIYILDGGNEIVSINIPKDIHIQDYLPENIDKARSEKLRALMERADFIQDMSIKPKTNEEYFEEFSENKNAEIYKKYSDSTEVQETIKKIEPLKEETKIKIASFELKELGFGYGDANYDQIIERAKDMGLDLCVPQVALEIALNPDVKICDQKNKNINVTIASDFVNGRLFKITDKDRYDRYTGKRSIDTDVSRELIGSFQHYVFSIKE